MEILQDKRNRAVGPDGIHVEMLQAAPIEGAKLISAWCSTVGRFGMFRKLWGKGIICPLYKKKGPNLN